MSTCIRLIFFFFLNAKMWRSSAVLNTGSRRHFSHWPYGRVGTVWQLSRKFEGKRYQSFGLLARCQACCDDCKDVGFQSSWIALFIEPQTNRNEVSPSELCSSNLYSQWIHHAQGGWKGKWIECSIGISRLSSVREGCFSLTIV
jgi:hypothetical protein